MTSPTTSLAGALIILSEATKVAHDIAIDTNRPDVGIVLVEMGHAVAALIGVALRGELEGKP